MKDNYDKETQDIYLTILGAADKTSDAMQNLIKSAQKIDNLLQKTYQDFQFNRATEPMAVPSNKRIDETLLTQANALKTKTEALPSKNEKIKADLNELMTKNTMATGQPIDPVIAKKIIKTNEDMLKDVESLAHTAQEMDSMKVIHDTIKGDMVEDVSHADNPSMRQEIYDQYVKNIQEYITYNNELRETLKNQTANIQKVSGPKPDESEPKVGGPKLRGG